jgi:putative transposase
MREGLAAGIERRMRENEIHARHKRRYKVATDSKHGLPVAENLLARNFTPASPNQVWTSDITYLWTAPQGWLSPRLSTHFGDGRLRTGAQAL